MPRGLPALVKRPRRAIAISNLPINVREGRRGLGDRESMRTFKVVLTSVYAPADGLTRKDQFNLSLFLSFLLKTITFSIYNTI